MHSITERLLTHIATMRTLATCDPLAPETHILLAGALSEMSDTIKDVSTQMATVEDPKYTASNWKVCIAGSVLYLFCVYNIITYISPIVFCTSFVYVYPNLCIAREYLAPLLYMYIITYISFPFSFVVPIARCRSLTDRRED